LGILDSLTPLTLKMSLTRFWQGTFGNINSSAIKFSKWRRSTPLANTSLRGNLENHR
jgi:hypothetical protein